MSRPRASKTPETDSDDPASAEVRRKYHYRRLVMTDGIKIPARLAMKLVGPDCAYQLYSQHRAKSGE